MRAIAALLLAVCLPAGAQVTFQRWQDMGAYVGKQTEKLNQHTDEIAALKARIAALEAQDAKNRENISHIIAHSDVMVRYAVELECNFNKNITGVVAMFSWVKPFELGDIPCPQPGDRYYLPYYLSPSGPVLPPAQ